jgi:hypothetical protein
LRLIGPMKRRWNCTSAQVEKALLKNASAFITEETTYTAMDGKEKKIEAVFTRYSLVFTGEKLPDGQAADAVFLVLDDLYREILNNAKTPPLNCDYLREPYHNVQTGDIIKRCGGSVDAS